MSKMWVFSADVGEGENLDEVLNNKHDELVGFSAMLSGLMLMISFMIFSLSQSWIPIVLVVLYHISWVSMLTHDFKVIRSVREDLTLYDLARMIAVYSAIWWAFLIMKLVQISKTIRI